MTVLDELQVLKVQSKVCCLFFFFEYVSNLENYVFVQYKANEGNMLVN